MGSALRYAAKHPVKNRDRWGRPRRELDKVFIEARKEKYVPIDELLDSPIIKTLRILGHFTSCPTIELLSLIGAPEQNEDPERRKKFIHHLGDLKRRGLIDKNEAGYNVLTWRGTRYLTAQMAKAQIDCLT